MKFDVYCDESRPDLFCSKKPLANFVVIGSLWLQTEDRQKSKDAIHALRNRYKVGGEFKWQKVSPSKSEFYLRLVDFFFDQGDRMRFRCIAVDRNKINLLHYHENDQELGFYKFYYQMLHHWILDCNDYGVFCDFKLNREMQRLPDLHRCLRYANLSSTISKVQATRSEESVLIQLADVLTGAASARINRSLREGTAKESLVRHIEDKLGRAIAHTWRSEQKFNVFDINPGGGW